MELCDGDLITLFQLKNANHPWSLENAHLKFKAIKDVSKGCTFIHECGIIHFDLKCSNILFKRLSEDDYVFKICDFGVRLCSDIWKKKMVFYSKIIC
jgi:serine/threonine protein kinase